MTEKERVDEWVRLYKASHLTYRMNSLLSVLESDGEKVLTAVLRSLGLLQSLDLVKDARERVISHPDRSLPKLQRDAEREVD